MTTGDDDLLRHITKEVLAELLPGLLEDALETRAGNGNGQRAPSHAAPVTEGDAVVPQVPAPPIAKVHRPSGWRAPAPAETVPESSAPAVNPGGAAIDRVALRSDADLDEFVRVLARRLEDPRDRKAILSGEVRFRLAAAGAAEAAAVTVTRIEAGAVTERTVKEAAKAGARLVLSPRAVLTPMARDRARSLGVEIEKERPC
jgi:hypothetical protein